LLKYDIINPVYCRVAGRATALSLGNFGSGKFL